VSRLYDWNRVQSAGSTIGLFVSTRIGNTNFMDVTIYYKEYGVPGTKKKGTEYTYFVLIAFS
jgi:hypothetical protein